MGQGAPATHGGGNRWCRARYCDMKTHLVPGNGLKRRDPAGPGDISYSPASHRHGGWLLYHNTGSSSKGGGDTRSVALGVQHPHQRGVVTEQRGHPSGHDRAEAGVCRHRRGGDDLSWRRAAAAGGPWKGGGSCCRRGHGTSPGQSGIQARGSEAQVRDAPSRRHRPGSPGDRGSRCPARAGARSLWPRAKRGSGSRAAPGRDPRSPLPPLSAASSTLQ